MKARLIQAAEARGFEVVITGAGDTMADVHRSIERATERTEQMEARAAALEELEASGQLESVLDEGDSVDQELDRLSDERAVENDWRRCGLVRQRQSRRRSRSVARRDARTEPKRYSW